MRSVLKRKIYSGICCLKHVSQIYSSKPCLGFSTHYYSTGTQMIDLLGRSFKVDEMTNISETITNKLNKQLHNKNNHPLQIVKSRIVNYFHGNFRNRHGGCVFAAIDNLNPIVTIRQNFDDLLVPIDHVSRSRNDNYYINSFHMLRAHTTAHEIDLIRSGWNAFLNTGDCYRRDEIDRNHFPVFHQMEGVRIFDDFQLFEETNVSISFIKIFKISFPFFA